MYGSKDISFDRSDSISNVDTTWHSIPHIDCVCPSSLINRSLCLSSLQSYWLCWWIMFIFVNQLFILLNIYFSNILCMVLKIFHSIVPIRYPMLTPHDIVFLIGWFCGRLSFRLHKHYTFSLESRLLPFTVSTNLHHIVFNHVSLIERKKYAWNNVMNVKSRKLTPNKTQVYHLLGAQIKNLRFGNIYFKVCHLRIVSDFLYTTT
jgi:hypothetical protein